MSKIRSLLGLDRVSIFVYIYIYKYKIEVVVRIGSAKTKWCSCLYIYIGKYSYASIPHHRVRDASIKGIFQVQKRDFKYIG